MRLAQELRARKIGGHAVVNSWMRAMTPFVTGRSKQYRDRSGTGRLRSDTNDRRHYKEDCTC
jgi:hypothetical protein